MHLQRHDGGARHRHGQVERVKKSYRALHAVRKARAGRPGGPSKRRCGADRARRVRPAEQPNGAPRITSARSSSPADGRGSCEQFHAGRPAGQDRCRVGSRGLWSPDMPHDYQAADGQDRPPRSSRDRHVGQLQNLRDERLKIIIDINKDEDAPIPGREAPAACSTSSLN